MTEQVISSDPNEPPPILDGNEWFYNDGGTRRGPVPSSTIKELLAKKRLASTDQVWRRGMQEWQSIRESGLSQFVADEPPPLVGVQVNNTLVWIVALAPLAFGLIDLALATDPAMVMARAIGRAGGLPFKEREIPIAVSSGLYGLLLLWDEYRLGKAGYTEGRGMKVLALLLVPVYLFVRAKKLKQRPTYAITWIALVALFTVLLAAAQS